MARRRDREVHVERIKKLHGERRKNNKCIGNKKHGDAYKGGRCKPCWEAKLQAERERTAKRRAERVAEAAEAVAEAPGQAAAQRTPGKPTR